MKAPAIQLHDKNFYAHLAKGGLSYALICKEDEAKRVLGGKGLSAAERSLAEQWIRNRVKAAKSDTIDKDTAQQIANEISAHQKFYAQYNMADEAWIPSYPADVNADEWRRNRGRPKVEKEPKKQASSVYVAPRKLTQEDVKRARVERPIVVAQAAPAPAPAPPVELPKPIEVKAEAPVPAPAPKKRFFSLFDF